MMDGFWVFHDFPAENFNIDHVVVGRTGVFAVETKARSKPDSGNRKQDAQLEYTGKELRFPHAVEAKPVEQARNQAIWLDGYAIKLTKNAEMLSRKVNIRILIPHPRQTVTSS